MNKYIAIATTKSDNTFYGNFGVAPYFLIFDKSGELKAKRINPHGIGNSQIKSQKAELIINILQDCDFFVCRKMGEKTKNLLADKYGIVTLLIDHKSPYEFIKEYVKKG